MSTVQSEVEKAYYLYDSGQSLEIYRDVDGNVQLGIQGAIEEFSAQSQAMQDVAEMNQQTPQPYGGVEDQTEPFAIAGPVTPTGVGEFAQKTAETFGGAAAGAGAVTIGLPGDLIAFGEGLYGAATAEDGQRLDAFLEDFSNRSEQIGSMATLQQLDQMLQASGLPPETQENIRAGSKYLGEWGEIPGGIAAAVKLIKGAKKYAAGAQARVAEKGQGFGTLSSGVDPLAAVDQAIVGAQKLLGQTDGITLGPASAEAKVNQLSPEYRVTVEGFTPEGTGKQAFIPKAITPKNFEQSSLKLDELATEFPDPLASQESYALMMAKTNNRAEVQAPPAWMIEHANNPEKFAEWFKQLTPDQVKAADEGLAIQSKFQDAYKAGAGPQVTGQLMLWSILSRMLSAFPHESGYKDLAQAAVPFIDKAASGVWEKSDTDAWLKLVKETIPADSPGRSATSNANDFGKIFLAKMAQTDAAGKSGLTRLHELMADQNVSSQEIRRRFYGIAQDTGIKNKILSFALLVSGRNDVVVLDRIQINRMWAGGEKVYDDIASQFDGAQGLVHYEALERSLANKVPDLYNRVGRGDQGSVGRYHWESWVLSSGQVVAHPTLEGVVRTAKGGDVANIPVKEGRFHQKRYGAEYEKLPSGGHRYIYRTSDGTPFEFTKESLDKMFDQAFKKTSGVLPPDFPGVKAFEGKSTPWYEYEGVDRGKLDELIRESGKPTS